MGLGFGADHVDVAFLAVHHELEHTGLKSTEARAAPREGGKLAYDGGLAGSVGIVVVEVFLEERFVFGPGFR
jgi:hypothetical protein